MCWNENISFTFFIIFIVTNSYYVIKKPKYWIEYLLFGGFYTIMEGFQTLQWLFGQVQEFNLTGANNCSTINTNFTIVAHILIWLQPILFSYIGYRTSNKRIFRVLFTINLIIFFYSLIVIYKGFHNPVFYSIENSIFGTSTCTNAGSKGHLVWKIKPNSVDYFPNYLMYLTMCSLSFFLYSDKDVRIIGWGWLLALLVTKIILNPTTLEVASTWCLLSIVGNFVIIANQMIK
jgi:hypothetical protein